MKKKISIDQIKIFFKKKYLIINKKKQNKENSIGSIARTFLASLLMISFFSISPILIEFKKNTSVTSSDYGNNSKNDLNKLLEKKDMKSDNILNNKFLYSLP